MNNLPNSREELEGRLTALLLGELPPEQAFELGRAIEQDAELAKLYARLKKTVELVRETTAEPAPVVSAEAAPAAPLKLSDPRRESLLARFKTVKPREFAEPKSRLEAWLVPLAAAAIVLLLAVIVLPNFIKARTTAQSNAIINNLRQLDGAKQQWALDNRKSPEAQPTMVELAPYLRSGGLQSVAGEKYVVGRVDQPVAADLDKARGKVFGGRYQSGTRLIELGRDVRLQLADGDASTLVSDLSTARRSAGEVASAAPAPSSVQQYKRATTYRYVEPLTVTNAAASVAENAPETSRLFDSGRGAYLGFTTNYQLADNGKSEQSAFYATPVVPSQVNSAEWNQLNANLALKAPASVVTTPIASTTAGVAVPEARLADGKAVSVAQSQAASSAESFRRRYGLPGGTAGGGGGGGAGGRSETFEVLRSPQPPQTLAEPVIDPTTGLPARAAIPQVTLGPTTGLPLVPVPARPAPVSPMELEGKPLSLGDQPQLGQSLQIVATPPPVALNAVPLSSAAAPQDRERKLALAEVEKGLPLTNLETVTRVRRHEGDGITNVLDLNVVGYVNVASTDGFNLVANQIDTQNQRQNNALRANERRPQKLVEAEQAWATPPKDVQKLEASKTQSGASSKKPSSSDLVQAMPATVEDTLLAAQREQLHLAEQSLANKRKQFGPDNPEVVRNSQEIDQLKDKIKSREVSLLKRTDQSLSADLQGFKETDEKVSPKPSPLLEPQPEILTRENAFSTFSLNVSDVSFKLAAASLEKGQLPDPGSIRSEEFINAFDYRDPEPAPGAPLAFASERARYPFAHNRDLLRFSIKTAAAGRLAGRPLNLVLLVDNSGSMERADRVQILREALRVLAGQLQPQDKLSVITFARTAQLRVDGVSGDKAGPVAEEISGLTPQGGTNLEEAMNLAYQTATRHYLPNGINRVVLLTDGAANLGDVEPASLKQKVETQRQQGIALDCFGIGWEGFNDDLLETLSRNGDGRYGFINTPEEAATEFAGKLAGALRVAASDVKVQVEFNPNRVTAYRQVGYAKHQLTKEQFRDNTVDAAEIGAAESGNALYVIEVNPGGEGPLAIVRVRFKTPGTNDYREHEWVVPFTGNALGLEQASPALKLAATAGAFSEWLAGSPYATDVTPDRLLGYLNGIPEVYGADARPGKIVWMIRQAKSLAGSQPNSPDVNRSAPQK